MKNMICAMSAAAAAIPPNPNTAAINAIMKNIITHLNNIIKSSPIVFKF